MNVFAFLTLNYSLKLLRSDGSSQVFGKKLNSFGNCFCIAIKFLASKFFLASAYIPGKWLVLYQLSILHNRAGIVGPSIHQMSHSSSSSMLVRKLHYAATSCMISYWV